MVRSVQGDSVPHGWKYDYLDNFTVRGSGHTPNKEKPEYWNGGVKWVSLSDSFNLDKGLISETDKEISDEGIKNSSAVIHPAGTVILSRDAGVGKSAVLASKMAVSQHFMAWRCDNSSKMNSWFLYNWLQVMKPEFERQAVGSTIKTIGLPYFKKLKIAVPPYSEQSSIAKILSVWDQAISTNEKILEFNRLHKASLIQQLLTGKYRFPEFKKKWQNFLLSDMYLFKRGKNLSKDDLSTEGQKCILYGELYTKYDEVISVIHSKTKSEAGLISKAGDILIPASTTTSGMDLANATAIMEDNVLLGGDINVLRQKHELCAPFMAHLLTHIKKNDITSRAQGITIIHLYGKDLQTINVFIPTDIEEQNKIAAALATADLEIKNSQAKISCLKQEKKALMQQLLTGKRRVKVDAVEACANEQH